MNGSTCSMQVALDKLTGDHETLAAARTYLEQAVFYARQYETVWNSIYWKTAKPAVKRRVRERLNHLAFDAYSALLEGADCLDRYGEEVKASLTPPVWWGEMVSSLHLAHRLMVREHPREIAARQLGLFEPDFFKDSAT